MPRSKHRAEYQRQEKPPQRPPREAALRHARHAVCEQAAVHMRLKNVLVPPRRKRGADSDVHKPHRPFHALPLSRPMQGNAKLHDVDLEAVPRARGQRGFDMADPQGGRCDPRDVPRVLMEFKDRLRSRGENDGSFESEWLHHGDYA